MYIGKQPTVGNFQVCDAITVVNGQAAYTMQVSSANVNPENANHMLVSLNGVLQKPGSSFTISGATITFASNLATGDVIDFIILLGNVLDIGAPSDGTVTTAKIADDAVTYAKATGFGKVLQVVSTTKTDTFSGSATSDNNTYSDITGMSLAITPASSSNKILVNFSAYGNCYDSDGWIRLSRGSTAICIGDASSNHRGISTGKFNIPSSNIALLNYTNTYLDSPSTTSETTYKLQFATNGAAFYFNRTWNDADSSAGPRVASTITAMEIGV